MILEKNMPILDRSFDKQLKEIDIYQRYPSLLPFIGEKYQDSELPRILLLGESHYLPKINSGTHLEAEKWYQSSQEDLYIINKDGEKESTELKWMNTRGIINKNKDKTYFRKKGHAIFRNINKALHEKYSFPRLENHFSHTAYMNAYLRPAEKLGKSIKSQPLDIEHSLTTIKQILEIIQPEKVIFVSSKSYDKIGKKLKLKNAYRIPHPASPWWHRKSSKGTGKEQFFRALN